TGKGIYDWRAIEHTLSGRIPENTVLSHDLLEGVHGRVGLATDLILLEQFPPNTATYMRRLHRWVRGDWQLLPWLFRRVRKEDGSLAPNPVKWFHRWKIIDNLRRSLMPPATLALLLLAWLGWLPGSALAWTIAIAALAAAPLLADLLGLATRVVSRPAASPALVINAPPSLLRHVEHWLISLMLLPYQTNVLLDAIFRTLIRLGITRRHLLEWTTAAHAHRRMRGHGRLIGLVRELWASPVVAIVATVLIGLINPSALPVAAPFLLAWLLAPLVVSWLDRPLGRKPEKLSAADQQFLRTTARRTWLFFERFVSPDNHWLPPDN
ncbi:MAG: cyclic beta 1-2 glucan synthetase, partial [Wenzhouxiangella sp.]